MSNIFQLTFHDRATIDSLRVHEYLDVSPGKAGMDMILHPFNTCILKECIPAFCNLYMLGSASCSGRMRWDNDDDKRGGREYDLYIPYSSVASRGVYIPKQILHEEFSLCAGQWMPDHLQDTSLDALSGSSFYRREVQESIRTFLKEAPRRYDSYEWVYTGELWLESTGNPFETYDEHENLVSCYGYETQRVKELGQKLIQYYIQEAGA